MARSGDIEPVPECQVPLLLECQSAKCQTESQSAKCQTESSARLWHLALDGSGGWLPAPGEHKPRPPTPWPPSAGLSESSREPLANAYPPTQAWTRPCARRRSRLNEGRQTSPTNSAPGTRIFLADRLPFL